jgi:hypothetical protein
MSIYDKLPDDVKYLVTKPATETGLKDYTFELLSQTEHSRGICWVGVLLHKGTKMATVENQGDGGANRYQYGTPEARKKIEQLAKRVYPKSYEPIDSLISFLDVASTANNG